MTVPSSVSSINDIAFVSATSAVRSHGHRRRYQRSPEIRDRDSRVMGEGEIGGWEKERETGRSALRKSAFSTMQEKKYEKGKKKREKKFNRRRPIGRAVML
jgi:hypothetical protein